MEQAPNQNPQSKEKPKWNEYIYITPERQQQIREFIHTYMWPFPGKQAGETPQIPELKTGVEHQREQKAAKGTGAMLGGLAGLGGYYLAVWPIGKTLKYLMLTDFGTPDGWKTDSAAQRMFNQGYQKGTRQAA